MEQSRTLSQRLSEAVLLFLLFGFIGWIYEVGLAFLYGYGYINRGFLFGPYLPLYGFGALLLIGCLSGVMRRKVKLGPAPATPAVVFVLIVLITTAVEYLASVVLEVIFDQRWWDYSTYDYQFQGRISLSASLRFGLGGMVFLYLLAPLFRRLFRRFRPRTLRRAAWIIVAVLLLDFVLTLVWANANGFNPELAQPR